MTKIDQFESSFRAAVKERFAYEQTTFPSILVVTDLPADAAREFAEKVKLFLNGLGKQRVEAAPQWDVVAGEDYRSVHDLLQLVDQKNPDLICSYRNLHSEAWRWPYTLGDHIEVLTQITNYSVLVLPHPKSEEATDAAMANTDTVMTLTDHLTGDHRLVNTAASLTDREGTLWLTHVEDDAVFDRYIEIISKIDTIDTDEARTTIERQLLKEPTDYIGTCKTGLAGLPIKVETLVTMGHRLREYRRMIEDHEVDLLVLNTKDEDQLAMHGLAYPLAVELRHVPMLLL